MKFDDLDIDMLMKNLGLDYLDIKILREYDDDTINEIDVENVVHIFKYLMIMMYIIIKIYFLYH